MRVSCKKEKNSFSNELCNSKSKNLLAYSYQDGKYSELLSKSSWLLKSLGPPPKIDFASILSLLSIKGFVGGLGAELDNTLFSWTGGGLDRGIGFSTGGGGGVDSGIGSSTGGGGGASYDGGEATMPWCGGGAGGDSGSTSGGNSNVNFTNSGLYDSLRGVHAVPSDSFQYSLVSYMPFFGDASSQSAFDGKNGRSSTTVPNTAAGFFGSGGGGSGGGSGFYGGSGAVIMWWSWS